MFSQNPRSDYYRLIIPDTFFVPAIVEKYNVVLSQKPYVLHTIQDMLLESIMNFDSPEFGFTGIKQNQIDSDNAGFERRQLPKTSFQLLTEKTFQITFRHTDGFMTYFLMLEHFFHYYKMGADSTRKPWGTTILETLLPVTDKPICRIKFKGCMLSGIPNLSLTYAGPSRDLTSFTCTFEYNQFETTFEIPSLKVK